MRSIFPLAATALMFTTGCPTIGEISTNPEVGPDADTAAEAARAAFDEDVMPALSGFCVACHAADDSVGFLAGPDVYENVKSWPDLIDLEQPVNSALLTKGSHDGPAWTVEQAPPIANWIALEAVADGIEPIDEPETEPFTPTVGINTVDLTSIGMPGCTITFRLEQLQVGFYVSELMLNSGVDGAHIVHPLFVTWTDGQPAPDPIDRFGDVELDVEPSSSAMVGGGTLVMVDIAPGSQLSIHFQVAEPSIGGGDGGDGGGGLGGGCDNVAAFTANAQPVLAQSCAGCHSGSDASATNATDMTRINDLSPEGQELVCAQILSRINLADTINSGLFLAPDPGSGAGHPFKFLGDVTAFEAFRDAILLWVAQE